jgi:hypothetical protein
VSGTIQLKYLQGIIPESELDLIRSQLGDLGIDFECIDISGEPQASIEEFLAPIILYLSSDIIQAYILGLATSTSYDIIRTSVIKIWRHVSGKTIRKTTPSEVESIAANFDLDINTIGRTRVKFKLKGDISDSLKEKCVDKAFQLLEAKAFPEIRTGYVCLYNVDDDEWEIFEDIEFVKNFFKAQGWLTSRWRFDGKTLARFPRLSSNVRRGQNKNAVPAERSALSFAKRAWPGA